MNICENCGGKTRKQELWGIAICQKCIGKYNQATNKAVKELIKVHNSEFEGLRDRYITEIFIHKVGMEDKNEK